MLRISLPKRLTKNLIYFGTLYSAEREAKLSPVAKNRNTIISSFNFAGSASRMFVFFFWILFVEDTKTSLRPFLNY